MRRFTRPDQQGHRGVDPATLRVAGFQHLVAGRSGDPQHRNASTQVRSTATPGQRPKAKRALFSDIPELGISESILLTEYFPFLEVSPNVAAIRHAIKFAH